MLFGDIESYTPTMSEVGLHFRSCTTPKTSSIILRRVPIWSDARSLEEMVFCL